MNAEPILKRALRDGAIFTVAVAVVAGLIGVLIAGMPGLLGGLLGALLAFVFLGLTAASIIVAGRVTKDDPGSPVFFGIVLGTWGLKLILFLLFALWLRTQDWLDPAVFFFTVIVSVVGSLILDVVAFQRTRVPYVGDVELPGDKAATTADDGPDAGPEPRA